MSDLPNTIENRKLLERVRSLEHDLLQEKAAHSITKDFLAIVSHDLQSPLGAISMSAEIVLDSLSHQPSAVTPEIINYLKMIRRNTRNSLDLINELLDAERIAIGKIPIKVTMGDLIPAVQEAIDIFRPFAEKHKIGILCKFPSVPVEAPFDKSRLNQILTNLLSNALKFTERGTVTIEIVEHSETVEVVVIDTGVGIPGKEICKVFDRHTQITKDDRRGIGLGLYITKWIVTAHGGEVWCVSKEGIGSEFHFTLPKY